MPSPTFTSTLIIIVVVLTLASCSSSVLVSARELKRVVFAHRHGARACEENYNNNCEVTAGCFDLTVQGQQMLENLGDAFRQAYCGSGKLIPVDSNTGMCRYDINNIKAVSDDSKRVIQSSGSFWRGAFGSNSGNSSCVGLPRCAAPHLQVLDSGEPGTTNYDIINNIRLANTAHLSVIGEKANRWAMLNFLKKSTMTVSQIQQCGKEINYNSPVELDCSTDKVLSTHCPMQIEDIMHMYIPLGWNARFPSCMKILPQLDQLRMEVLYSEYGKYDEQVVPNGTQFLQEGGWAGVKLAQAMLLDAMNPDLLLSEFSAHDTSLIRLWAALGNTTFNYPRVGTAFVLEVYDDFHVTPVLYHPNQDPKTGFVIEKSEYAIKCMQSDGATYVSSAGCSFSDLNRYVESRTGTKAGKDSCWIWPADVKALKCEPSDPPHGECLAWRALCPFDACGKGMRMLKNLTCVSL